MDAAASSAPVLAREGLGATLTLVTVVSLLAASVGFGSWYHEATDQQVAPWSTPAEARAQRADMRRDGLRLGARAAAVLGSPGLVSLALLLVLRRRWRRPEERASERRAVGGRT